MVPLYKRLKTNGTTFYAFPGAAEDISAAYQNQNYRMYFSKYVLLNLPKQNLTSGTNSNPIKWDFENAFEKSVFSTPATNYKEQLVESLRNYVANYEVTIKDSRLNNTEYYYDSTEMATPTEKIFWNWCKKLNLLQLEVANNGDEYFGNLPEFERNNLSDDEYFNEILWRERETTAWNPFQFYETAVPGYTNKLEIEFQGTTNFRVGDIIQLDGLDTAGSLFALLGNGKRFTVEEIIPASGTQGQRVVTSQTYAGSLVTNTEEPDATVKLFYHRLVQYIGEVNGINNVNEATRSYTEVYAHIPDHTGRTPDILFRTKVDANYKPNMTFPILPSQYQPEIKGAETFTSPIVQNPANYPGGYYGQFDTVDFTYETQTGDSIRRSGDYYGISGDFNNPVTDGTTVDGLCIDFDPAHYVKMNIIGREITTFDQFNAMMVNNQPPADFDFNAILWYYTVQDLNGNQTTNLYGISFVDNPDNNPVESEVGLRVPLFKKLAANDNQDGTSYAFSLNLNFSIINENPQDTYNPEAINSLFSFNLYNEAMRRLALINESFLNIIAQQGSLQQEVSDLRQLLYTQTDLNLINTRINNLEDLLRLYATNQIVSTDSIRVDLDTTTTPPGIRLTNIQPQYTSILTLNTSFLYTANGAIVATIAVPEGRDFMVNIVNDDITDLTLPNNEKITLLLSKDLAYRQSFELNIIGSPISTQNKGLELYMNFAIGGGTPVETLVLSNIDLPVFYNLVAQGPNSASRWDRMNFQIDINQPLRLNVGGILEVGLNAPQNLVANSFKVGDVLQVKDFIVGSASQFNFSGQYQIDSINGTSILLNVNSNEELIAYGGSAGNIGGGILPVQFNQTTGYEYALGNMPYLDLNKGSRWRITRVSQSDTSAFEDRYLIQRIF